ncbi:uncharacterized protein LOC132716980 [Ruditapes philippinarum]|uniref:uncharacterized protein LOC132716980 n=1 Tax=Ruditapes philippinarum TaxID=129788 RepID=UPI00295B3B02|nr:uncharacterized protein LOC132716980 [Ruditapes philippinarum]
MIWSVLFFVVGGLNAHRVTIVNRCSHTVWVGILGSNLIDQGGYTLNAGASRTSSLPPHWSGRFWGKTGCHSNRCETGDCGGGKIQCNGAGGVPPATLAEITFDAGSQNIQDFYDVSLVDGFNLQMSMRPTGGYISGSGHYYCSRAGCNTDLNQRCPRELQVNGTGGVVACKSACLAFNRDDYCCRGAHNVPQTCPPSSYSKIFKSACPESYSYAYDDQTSTFTCNNKSPGSTSYEITFCG